MTISNIKEGDYIIEEFNDGRRFLNLIGKNKKPKYFISIDEKYYYKPNNTQIFNQKSLRYATLQEKEWLDTCVKAEKFIPLENINIEPIYEIY